MKRATNTLEFKFERTIPASPEEAYDSWLDPTVPGNPWHESDKLILKPVVDALFYWRHSGTAHYGLFTEVARPHRIQHTWMSPNTLGIESTVTVTFEKKGHDTLMTLVHSGLPDEELAKAHEKGWNYFLERFRASYPERSAKKS